MDIFEKREKQGVYFPATDQSKNATDSDVDLFASVERDFDVVAEFLPQMRVCLDIGAHVGINALVYSREFDFVHCFEPIVGDCLEKTLAQENVENYMLHRTAVGSERCRAKMIVNTHNFMRSFVYDHDHSANKKRTNKKGAEELEVQVNTIDFFKFEEVDFIKIDVEGYNQQVLDGMVETLKRCKPVVLIEDGQSQSQNDYMKKFFSKLKYTNVYTSDETPANHVYVPPS